MQGGAVEVGVGDDDPLSDLAEGEAEVEDHGRLALEGQGARDENPPERRIVSHHLELDAEPSKRVNKEVVILLGSLLLFRRAEHHVLRLDLGHRRQH